MSCLSDEELANSAAAIMYAPTDERTVAPLQFVIERLVMPKDEIGYTEKQIKDWILHALKDRG